MTTTLTTCANALPAASSEARSRTLTLTEFDEHRTDSRSTAR